jgi:AcrR family transcriptional regulator
MAKSSKVISTKDRILEVAERLFAERGLDGTSMRHITEAAGVNLASVNYHFGSKDGLIAAVFQRHLVPLNQARLAMLDAVETEAGSRAPTIEAVLEAFIHPTVAREIDSPRDSAALLGLLGRCMSEPAVYFEKHIRPHFEALKERFDAAVARALPELPADEIFWRMNFMIGALHHAIDLWGRPDKMPFSPDKPLDAEGLVRRLISFTAAGLRAPAAEQD